MARYTIVDIIMILFVLYHSIRSYHKGIKLLLFEEAKLFCAWLVAWFIYEFFYIMIVESVMFEILYSVFFAFIRPLTGVSLFMSLVPWKKLFFFAIFIPLVFIGIKYVFKSVAGDEKTKKEKIWGVVGGILKAVIYLFIIIAILDPVFQNMGTKVSPAITRSFFMPYLYKYNIVIYTFY